MIRRLLGALVCTASVALAVNVVPASAAASPLDKAFGVEGIAKPGIDGGYSTSVEEEWGRILVVANYGSDDDSLRGGNCRLARLNSDGTRDRSFGAEGLVMPYFLRNLPTIYGIDLQRNGRIIAVGANGQEVRNPSLSIMRFTKSGTPDPSFAHKGIRSLRVEGGSFESVLTDVHVLGSGKILATGYRNHRLFATRILPNGRLDHTFGGGAGMVSSRRDTASASAL